MAGMSVREPYNFWLRLWVFVCWPVIVPVVLVMMLIVVGGAAIVLVSAWPLLWFGRLVKDSNGSYRFRVGKRTEDE